MTELEGLLALRERVVLVASPSQPLARLASIGAAAAAGLARAIGSSRIG